MKPRAAILALALLSSVAGARSADAPPAVLRVDVTEAVLGDPIGATLVVRAGAEERVETVPVGPELGEVAVLGGAWSDPAAGTPERVWTWTGRLAAYRVGDVTVPPIPVGIVGPAGRRVVTTDPVPLSIRGVLQAEAPGSDEPDIADLKPPASVPPDYAALRLALAILALLLLATGLAAWLYRRLAPRLRAVAVPADPFRRLPPHEWAYEELGALIARRLVEQGLEALFFDEISRIVKQYLAGRFRVDLGEKTTSEVPHALDQAGASRDVVHRTRDLLDLADLVKFARATVAPERCRGAVDEAYRIVDDTKPVAEPQAGAA